MDMRDSTKKKKKQSKPFCLPAEVTAALGEPDVVAYGTRVIANEAFFKPVEQQLSCFASERDDVLGTLVLRDKGKLVSSCSKCIFILFVLTHSGL